MSKENKNQIRQLTLSDKETIRGFFQTVWEDRFHRKFTNRWPWLFINNPFLKKDCKSLPIYGAFDGSEMVGQTSAMVEPVKIGLEEHLMYWSIDTFVFSSQRGRGLGYGLLFID